MGATIISSLFDPSVLGCGLVGRLQDLRRPVTKLGGDSTVLPHPLGLSSCPCPAFSWQAIWRVFIAQSHLWRGMVHEMLQTFYSFTNASIAEFKESCNKGEHGLVVSASAQTHMPSHGGLSRVALGMMTHAVLKLEVKCLHLLVCYVCSCCDFTCKVTAALLQSRFHK